MLVLVGALLLGGILNGHSLLDTASALEPGWQRNVATRAAQLLVAAAETLHLDNPRDWIDRQLGRGPKPTVPLVIPPLATTTSTTSTTVATTITTTPAVTTQPPQTTSTLPTTTTLPGVFIPTAERPVRLWVTGDSLTERFGPALVNLLGDTGVVEAR
ncbi:MAG TPA: hypothetical protein VFZ80_06870, partial [Acidimicrobiia bacterium]